MKKLTILLLATILLTSCSKDTTVETPADTLPPATTTGANTAGCYVNGKLLIPKNGEQAIGGSPNYGLYQRQGNNFWPNKNDYFGVDISNKKDFQNFSVYVWIKDMQNGNGDYIVGQSNGQIHSNGPNNNQIFAYVNIDGTLKTYYSSINSGIIKITRSDMITGIAIFSGTFSATLYNINNPSETIQVTDGRFDINALTLNH